MSQVTMIRQHLLEVGSITPSTAIEEYGCFRLSARIADLRRMGMNIVTESETRINRFGRKVRFARYRVEQQS